MTSPQKKEVLQNIIWFLLVLLVILFFLSLGSDYPSQVHFKTGFGIAVFAVALLTLSGPLVKKSWQSKAVRVFIAVILFELVRAAWAFRHMHFLHEENFRGIYLRVYLDACREWIFYLLILMAGYFCFDSKEKTGRLLWVFSIMGFSLAMNAIPALLAKSAVPGYAITKGRYVFFYPGFYFHPWISKYILGAYAHVNYTSDVIAPGFFSALGILFYSLYLRVQKRTEEREWQFDLMSLGLPITMAGASGLAIVLFLSRGAIMALSAAIVFFLVTLLIKFPSKRQFYLVSVVLMIVAGFLILGGKLPRIWKELQTVQGEFNQKQMTSFDANREGAARALAMQQDHPLWGVGTRGFIYVSKKYASRGTYDDMMGARAKAFNHYLQIMAEEGIGAFFYLVFLAVYAIELLRGLVKTHSRFQFFSALALASTVVMMLTHGFINYLLQNFSMAVLLYFFMGASLGVLRKDFQHEA